MKYFKNTELAKLYNVSEKSVRNWVDAAKKGKLDLELYENNARSYVANTSKNIVSIEQLANKGKKYTNTRGRKVISPNPKFYNLFNAKEILDIISNLDTYREMPLQYSYFDGGAMTWDTYVQKLADETTPNILSNTIELLDMNADYIDNLLYESKCINIIDLGPGNCYPVRAMLERFIKSGRLRRYICIDISRDMLQIAEHNMREWFSDTIQFEGYVKDISYERFGDILAAESFGQGEVVRNIVLCFGSTISNFRDPVQPLLTIRESMSKDDLLIFSKQLDTPGARRDFDYKAGNKHVLAPKSRFTLELLNIDDSLYEPELLFDDQEVARHSQIRLKVALSIEFQINGVTKVVNFNKGDRILLWRHNHQTIVQAIEQFNDSGFDLLQATSSRDQECLLSISKIKTN